MKYFKESLNLPHSGHGINIFPFARHWLFADSMRVSIPLNGSESLLVLKLTCLGMVSSYAISPLSISSDSINSSLAKLLKL